MAAANESRKPAKRRLKDEVFQYGRLLVWVTLWRRSTKYAVSTVLSVSDDSGELRDVYKRERVFAIGNQRVAKQFYEEEISQWRGADFG